jgi:hypothetical protein
MDMDKIRLEQADSIRATFESFLLAWIDASSLSEAQKIDAVIAALASYKRELLTIKGESE